MNTTLHGFLISTLIFGALLSIAITWLLLRRYKRRVVALMRKDMQKQPDSAASTPAPIAQGVSYSIQVISERQGCVYEIKELFKLIPIEKVLFIADKSTNKPFLEKVMNEACREIPAGSPNDRSEKELLVRVYVLEGEKYSIYKLLKALEFSF